MWADAYRRAAGLGAGASGLARSGMLGPYRPGQLWRVAQALRSCGLNLGATYAAGAARWPQRVALADGAGALSFGEMDRRTATVAAGLADLGWGPGDRVGLLARNHRDFVTAIVALARLGTDTVHLNTGFAGPQLEATARRERLRAVVVDEDLLPAAQSLRGRFELVVTAGAGYTGAGVLASFAGMLAGGSRPGPAAPGVVGAQVVLTSGTTGAPRGARRHIGAEVGALTALLSRIPLRASDTTVVAAPAFHSWGLANVAVGLALGSTLVMVERFDPGDTLALIEAHRATVLVGVPVMLQRIMELAAPARAARDVSSLRVVAVSGSALPGGLATRFMDGFGEVVYNLYGSTEVGWASVATPADLRAAPATAGRPLPGARLRLVGPDGRQVRPGEPGRIFVRSRLSFDGYSGGGSREVVGGYMASGDVGHLDGAGRLHVDGRDDDMIVSGGENVFPFEVEDLLARHRAVAEVAVVGVDDDAWGQRLDAYVVLREGVNVAADELRDHVRDHLARYKVPRRIAFLPALPRNATGKVMRSQLVTTDLAHTTEAPTRG
ncbi:MAG: AMP-binding protein [Acidimicrobiales bacterium]